MFDLRIGYLSREESASLRLCRKIVADALSDFKVRLPEQPPLALTAHLAFADGREEGSKHPNLMLASERQSHGL